MFIKIPNNCSGLSVVCTVLCIISFCLAEYFRVRGSALARGNSSNPCVKRRAPKWGLGLERKSVSLLLLCHRGTE